MNIAVFGLGYVGFTAMCCIAKLGHHVIGVDVSSDKVSSTNYGKSPISEPGVNDLLSDGLKSGRIRATSDVAEAIEAADIAIVCVGTPSAPDGSHDMSHIAEVSRQIASHISPERSSPLAVVFRSTIRPGTTESLIEPIFRSILGEATDRLVELVYHPEFLREATAVQDFFHPPKLVVGTRDGSPCPRLDQLNESLLAPTFNVCYGEAEITKFVDNTWHAIKVAYANEIGRICLQLNLSSAMVSEIFLSDTKLNISKYYMRPGGAFGGSCLPKDVRALQYMAADSGAHTQLIDSVLQSNNSHKRRLFEYAVAGLKPGARILLVGLAFKAGTDDLRESPNVDLARSLLREGFRLSIYDPDVDASKLVGANLGYAYTQMPQLRSLLIDREAAEAGQFDRVIAANSTIFKLRLRGESEVVDLHTLP